MAGVTPEEISEHANHSMKKKLNIIIIIALLIGIIIGLVLIQRQTQLKSKADLDLSTTFTVIDEIGNEVNCSGTTCTTYSDTVHIQFNQESLEDLKGALP